MALFLLAIYLAFTQPACVDTYTQVVELGVPSSAPIIHQCEAPHTYTLSEDEDYAE